MCQIIHKWSSAPQSQLGTARGGEGMGEKKKIDHPCLSMKNKRQQRRGCRSFQHHAKQIARCRLFVYARVCLRTSACPNMLVYIYACECAFVCVCARAGALARCCGSYLDVFVIFLHQHTPGSHPRAANGKARPSSRRGPQTGRRPACGLN